MLGFDDFADVLLVASEVDIEGVTSTVLDLTGSGGGTVTLLGVAMDELHEDDFGYTGTVEPLI